MQIGNVTKAATFKSSLHQTYKSVQLLLLWQSFLIIFTRRFFGATQKLELHFSFKPTTLLKLCSSKFLKKLLLDLFFHYRGVFRTQSKIYDGLFGENSQAKRFHLRYLTGSKYASALVMNFSEVFFCFLGKR